MVHVVLGKRDPDRRALRELLECTLKDLLGFLQTFLAMTQVSSNGRQRLKKIDTKQTSNFSLCSKIPAIRR